MSFLDEVEKTDQDTVVSRVRDTKTFGEVSPDASITLPRVDAESVKILFSISFISFVVSWLFGFVKNF